MPHAGQPDGLYLIRQESPSKGVTHYGILDVGNRLRTPGLLPYGPVVIHQVPPAIRCDWLSATGEWLIVGHIADEQAALGRLRAALAKPAYHLTANNCEHFARFVAYGRKESTQVQGAALLVGAAVVAMIVIGRREGAA